MVSKLEFYQNPIYIPSHLNSLFSSFEFFKTNIFLVYSNWKEWTNAMCIIFLIKAWKWSFNSALITMKLDLFPQRKIDSSVLYIAVSLFILCNNLKTLPSFVFFNMSMNTSYACSILIKLILFSSVANRFQSINVNFVLSTAVHF